MISIGSKVRIKDEAWKRYLNINNLDANKANPGVKYVMEMPGHPPFNESVMLSGMCWWFNEKDVEEVSV